MSVVRRIVNQCIIFLCVLLCACGGAQEARRVRANLDDVASYINDRPDSALAVLRGIDSKSLPSRKDQARAALLHSIALDKCYVDITSDSILAPALAYYRHHGSADQRLKARYYRAVLARNAGDRDTQMAWLVEAERFIPRARDPEMAGFIYVAKRELYLDLLDTENAYANALLAANAFRSSGSGSRFANALISLSMLAQSRNQMDEAARWIDSLQVYQDYLTPKQLSSMYAVRLAQASEQDVTEIPNLVEEYVSSLPDDRTVLWLSVAEAYCRAGMPEEASDALDKSLSLHQTNEKDVHYLLVASHVYELAGQTELASSAYHQYHETLAERQARARESSARFESERQVQDRQKRRIWMGLILLTIVSLMGIGWLAVRLRKRSREVKDAQKRANQYRKEKGKTEQYLVSRLLKAGIAGSLPVRERSSQMAALLYDWKTILPSLIGATRSAHPAFVEYLEKQKLTLREQGYCCLFANGFSLQEGLAYYAGSTGSKNAQSYYNMTSAIRKKLQIADESQDLDQQICCLMAQLDG